MARRVGTAPTSSGFGNPCIACLPPPYWKIFSVLPFKDTETALPLYTLSQGDTTVAVLRALEWQISLVLR